MMIRTQVVFCVAVAVFVLSDAASDPDPTVSGSGCAGLTKRRLCKNAGCTWRKKTCLDKVELPSECENVTKAVANAAGLPIKKACKMVQGCAFSKFAKRCVPEGSIDKCNAAKAKKKCLALKNCDYDKTRAKGVRCHTATSGETPTPSNAPEKLSPTEMWCPSGSRFVPICPVDRGSEEDWVHCAGNWGTCECNGTVRYGADVELIHYTDKKWVYEENVTGSIQCSTKVFGDPLGGRPKECYCSSKSPNTIPTDCSPPTEFQARMGHMYGPSMLTDNVDIKKVGGGENGGWRPSRIGVRVVDAEGNGVRCVVSWETHYNHGWAYPGRERATSRHDTNIGYTDDEGRAWAYWIAGNAEKQILAAKIIVDGQEQTKPFYGHASPAHTQNNLRQAQANHFGVQLGGRQYKRINVEFSPKTYSTFNYFNILSFNGGYGGIQNGGGLPGGGAAPFKRAQNKRMLISKWDDGDHFARVVWHNEELEADDGMKLKCHGFGGEGTGAKCGWKYEWQVDHHYRFVLELEPVVGSDREGEDEFFKDFTLYFTDLTLGVGPIKITTLRGYSPGYQNAAGGFIEQFGGFEVNHDCLDIIEREIEYFGVEITTPSGEVFRPDQISFGSGSAGCQTIAGGKRGDRFWLRSGGTQRPSPHGLKGFALGSPDHPDKENPTFTLDRPDLTDDDMKWLVCPSGYSEQIGTTTDFKGVDVDSLVACSILCDEQTTCQAIQWDTTGSPACQLVTARDPNTEANATTMFCSKVGRGGFPRPRICSIDEHYVGAGVEYASAPANVYLETWEGFLEGTTDPRKCQSACKTSPNCLVYTIDMAQERCFLIKTPGANVDDASRYISGIKTCQSEKLRAGGMAHGYIPRPLVADRHDYTFKRFVPTATGRSTSHKDAVEQCSNECNADKRCNAFSVYMEWPKEVANACELHSKCVTALSPTFAGPWTMYDKLTGDPGKMGQRWTTYYKDQDTCTDGELADADEWMGETIEPRLEYCANAYQICECKGVIQWGTGDRWAYLQADGRGDALGMGVKEYRVKCTNQAIGRDPAGSQKKECYCDWGATTADSTVGPDGELTEQWAQTG